jgi:hypothetical protein
MKVSCCVLFAEVLKSESPGGSTEDGRGAADRGAGRPHTVPRYPACIPRRTRAPGDGG